MLPGAGCDGPTRPEPVCWEAIGPEGLDIFTLEESDHGLFAGGDDRLWRRDGTRWTQVLSGDWRTRDILFVPEHDLLMAATVPGIVDPFDPPEGPWVFRSWDRGAQWSPVDGGLNEYLGGFTSFLLSGSGSPPALFAGAAPKVARSLDLGTSWDLVRETPEAWGGGFEAETYSPANGWVWLGGTDPYGDPVVAWSEDGGASWNTVYNPAEATNRHISGFAVDPTDPNHVLAATVGGVLGTTDGGDTWIWHSGSASGLERYSDLVSTPGRLYLIGMVPAEGSSPFEPTITTSVDFGRTWQPVPLPEGYPEHHYNVEVMADGTIAIGTSSGVWLFHPAARPDCLPPS